LNFDEPFQKLTPPTFFRFGREYPNQEGVSWYVYQLLPKINRKQVGITTNYIGTYKEPLTEDQILAAHGSGKYWLTFTDANAPKGCTERASSTVEVYHPDMPNKIDPRELVLDDEKSKPYLDELRARGIVKGAEVTQTGSNEAVTALADLNKRLLEERGKDSGIGKELMQLLLVQLQRKDTSIEDAMKLAALMKPAESPLTAQLLKLLADRQTPPASDPFENWERVEKLMERAGARNPGKSGAWDKVLEAVPGILQAGLGMFSMWANSQRRGPIPSTAAAPVAAETIVDVRPDPEVELPPGDMDMLNPATMAALKNVAEKALKAFESGKTGDHFAAALCIDEQGERIYGALREMGSAGILNTMSMVPGLMDRLAARKAEIEPWLEAFIEYAAEEEPTA